MPKLAKKRSATAKDALPNTLRIAALAADRKALALRAYDVRGLTVVADSFIMCSATSEPHVRAIVEAVKRGMREIGVRPSHIEGNAGDDWILMDFGTTILNVFREEAREYYDLDGLWGDAPAIDLELDEPGQEKP